MNTQVIEPYAVTLALIALSFVCGGLLYLGYKRIKKLFQE